MAQVTQLANKQVRKLVLRAQNATLIYSDNLSLNLEIGEEYLLAEV